MKHTHQQEIFLRWTENYKGILCKVTRIYTDNPEDREDLFQEIAYQLWKSVPSFKGQSKESTWIYKVALNTSIKWIKLEKKYREIKDNILVHESDNDQELLDWMYHEISKFNDLDKSICFLILDGVNYKEISGITGLTEGNIAVKVHRIKKTLTEASKKLESYGI